MRSFHNRSRSGVAVALAAGLVGAIGALGVTPSQAAVPEEIQPTSERSVVVPAGVIAGVAVFDRQTRTYTERLNSTMRFRSASIVKLLIVLDFLWNRGPDYQIPDADRARLDVMLRRSDDDAASYYWDRDGGAGIVNRMVRRLGLANTAPPPAAYPGYWGFVAISAADTVTIYRYLLETAPAPVRDYVLGNLRQATRCGTDGFDQYFGIPSVYNSGYAIKQGWAGFAISGGCAGTPPNPEVQAADDEDRTGPQTSQQIEDRSQQVDLVREALHTTGTVGAGDRSIVAVLTLHPDRTPYGKAYTDLTRLTRSLNVPGAVPAAGQWFGTWGSGVQVRSAPDPGSAALATLPAGVDVLVECQRRGPFVVVPPYSSDWWAYLPKYRGYVSVIYLNGDSGPLPGVPVC